MKGLKCFHHRSVWSHHLSSQSRFRQTPSGSQTFALVMGIFRTISFAGILAAHHVMLFLTPRRSTHIFVARAFAPNRIFAPIIANSRIRLYSTSRNETFFASEVPDFASLGIQSPILLERLSNNLQLHQPTSVQSAAYSAIARKEGDVTVGAETGTGKVRH